MIFYINLLNYYHTEKENNKITIVAWKGDTPAVRRFFMPIFEKHAPLRCSPLAAAHPYTSLVNLSEMIFALCNSFDLYGIKYYSVIYAAVTHGKKYERKR